LRRSHVVGVPPRLPDYGAFWPSTLCDCHWDLLMSANSGNVAASCSKWWRIQQRSSFFAIAVDTLAPTRSQFATLCVSLARPMMSCSPLCLLRAALAAVTGYGSLRTNLIWMLWRPVSSVCSRISILSSPRRQRRTIVRDCI